MTIATYDETLRAELMAIIRERSFKQGKFTLSSGRESDLYFDMKPTMMHPRGAYISALGLIKLLRTKRFDFIGGLEMGAVPSIASMAALSAAEGAPIHTMFVRKEAKGHGTKKIVEGLSPTESLEGKHVVIIDDVATTGGSFLKAVVAAREAGAIVSEAICIVDREEGAIEALVEHGLGLSSLFKGGEFRT